MPENYPELFKEQDEEDKLKEALLEEKNAKKLKFYKFPKISFDENFGIMQS